MKIVVWVGNEPNQRALVNKIHEHFPLSGIVTETRKRKLKLTLKEIVEKGIEKILLASIAKAWFGMHKYYDRLYPEYPSVPRLNVENINGNEAYNFTKEKKPDLILVSGTRLIKQNLLSLRPSTGILNLHTGLSPYIKGGPNCTNWCISTRQFHLIGNTVMWIDEGIDSGNLLATEFTTFTGNESLSDVHIKLMEHAHSLYLRSIQYLVSGKANNVPQKEISPGITYFNSQWGLKQKIQLLRNMKGFRKKFKQNHFTERKDIKTVSLSEQRNTLYNL
jgi:methionyl-tRNA formyltransferase